MEEQHLISVDHDEIRRWAEDRGGRPQLLDDPTAGSDRVGIRIDFPGPADDAFLAEASHARDITWAEFFEVFDRRQLLFVCQEDTEFRTPGDSYHFEPRRG